VNRIIIIIFIILITSGCTQNKDLSNEEKNNKLSVQEPTKSEKKSKTNKQLTIEEREKLEQLEKEIREKQNQKKYEYMNNY